MKAEFGIVPGDEQLSEFGFLGFKDGSRWICWDQGFYGWEILADFFSLVLVFGVVHVVYSLEVKGFWRRSLSVSQWEDGRPGSSSWIGRGVGSSCFFISIASARW
jgi:hypothetical protein